MKIFIRIFALIGIIFGFTMCIFTICNDDNIYTVNYVVQNSKINSDFNGLKMVQLSDFHNHGLAYKNGYLPELIKNEDPDLIFLTGDLIDQYTKEQNVNDIDIFLNELSDYPIFYITGNHENYAAHVDEFYKVIFSHKNVTFLYDTYTTFSKGSSSINIAGLKDPYIETKSSELSEEVRVSEPALQNISSSLDDNFTILLSHRPSMLKLYAKYNMDLVFSGHTHGGQVNIWQFYEYQNGIHYLDDTTMIISNGIGCNGKMPIRVNAPMQIVSCTLQSN